MGAVKWLLFYSIALLTQSRRIYRGDRARR